MAIEDLKKTLKNDYGESFALSLNDEEIEEIGNLLLTTLSESLKMKMNVAVPEVLTNTSK